MAKIYECPKCGHVFERNEYYYDPRTDLNEFECSECGWEGDEIDLY